MNSSKNLLILLIILICLKSAIKSQSTAPTTPSAITPTINSTNTTITDNSGTPSSSIITLNISAIQFSDEDLLKVQNDTYMQTLTKDFETTISTFENEWCLGLKREIQRTFYKNISTLFGHILEQFLAHRCNTENCKFKSYWNSTNQNSVELNTFYNFISDAVYLLFPLFITFIMVGLLFGFCNCLYFNYCYCCCYKYEAVNKESSYFNKMFVALAISTTLYLGFGVFNESQFQNVSVYNEYAMCQIVNNNVYQLLTGINITDIDNKGLIDNTIYWQGLNYLNSSFHEYFDQVVALRTSLMTSSNIYMKSEDPVQLSFNEVSKGIESFKNYTSTTNFDVRDPNGNTMSLFNITYTCSSCKLHENINQIYAELNSTLRVWQNDMDEFRKLFYYSLVDDKGWKEMYTKHNATKTKIKANIYKSYKFYNIVMDSNESYRLSLNTLISFEFAFFIINGILCLLGIMGYRWVSNSI